MTSDRRKRPAEKPAGPGEPAARGRRRSGTAGGGADEVPAETQMKILRSFLRLALIKRFGPVPAEMLDKVAGTTNISRLRWWATRLATATTLAEMRIGTKRKPSRRRTRATREPSPFAR